MNGTVTHIRVTLKNIKHSEPDDFDVLLVGPTGRATTLISDALGNQAITGNGVTLKIDQSAASPVPDNGSVSDGFYKPANYNGNEILEPNGIDNFPSPGPGVANYSTANLDVFNGTNPNGDWKLFIVDDESGNIGTMSGWSFDLTTSSSRSNNLTADFDGDGRTDLSVFRPNTGTWWVQESLNNDIKAYQFGVSNDKPVPADYDGDGKTDIAVYRPSTSVWYVLRSSDFTVSSAQHGSPASIPVPGDYDGDGRGDLAVYYTVQSKGYWNIQRSTLGYMTGEFGLSTDIPVQSDYDGDGKTDVAVYRPRMALGG
jgi:subtilisin-like proprotein convertase family protein